MVFVAKTIGLNFPSIEKSSTMFSPNRIRKDATAITKPIKTELLFFLIRLPSWEVFEPLVINKMVSILLYDKNSVPRLLP